MTNNPEKDRRGAPAPNPRARTGSLQFSMVREVAPQTPPVADDLTEDRQRRDLAAKQAADELSALAQDAPVTR
ncbi:hypothetical protein MAUB_00490 [Mycolicibacterium aubagnense]|uniref:Uncharacterized protein n=1 Tax=Mycolicibacterium aubagnense TaxID=319707 RepID=A0ABM7I6L3_9MYCO|nr:hypothetical protein MAUB_00490 [Mycolicibacterium aubagnense]